MALALGQQGCCAWLTVAHHHAGPHHSLNITRMPQTCKGGGGGGGEGGGGG